MKKELTFHAIEQETWGFSALRPLSELRDHLGNPVGTLYLTYRNHPELVPGKPIWVFKRPEQGGWLVENEDSEEAAKDEVLRRLRFRPASGDRFTDIKFNGQRPAKGK
jgi:hypothetical protein